MPTNMAVAVSRASTILTGETRKTTGGVVSLKYFGTTNSAKRRKFLSYADQLILNKCKDYTNR